MDSEDKKEEHEETHADYHDGLRELVKQFLKSEGKDETATIAELMAWSDLQTVKPDHEAPKEG